jgi:tetratricopeptide repeat protein 21B
MIDDAAQQIEFVNEVQVSVGRTPEIAFLEAMLQARKPETDLNTKVTQTLKTLDECLRLHISQTKALNPGFEFYIRLNPDFLLSMSKGIIVRLI